MNQEEDLPYYNITLGIDDVRVLHYAVTEAIQTWTGTPARPQEEQELLWNTRDWLTKIILENTFQTK